MAEKIVKKILKLDGMTCIACETKIDKKLRKLEGVIDLKVSYVTSDLEIRYSEDKVSLNEITEIIRKLGYDVVGETNKKMEKETKKSDTNFWVITGIIILGLYLIIKSTVGFNFIPEVTTNMGFGILFVIGIMTSLHCVAMCGGINLSVCMSYNTKQNSSNKYAKFAPSLMYNSGRIISYTIVGGIFGAFGSVISITNGGKAFVSILAGVFMVIMGINMLNVFPGLRKLNPHMPKVFARKINKEKNKKGPFIVGLLNGLMPCGPLQAMQLYALGTGSFLIGATSMFFFSLGTVPLMFVFGALGSFLSARFTKNMVKASAALVVLLGVVMLNRGIAFTGFTFDSIMHGTSASVDQTNDTASTAAVESDSSVQKISTTLQAGQYEPITVVAGVPVEWTIVAEAGSLNGCNSEIIIPTYNIQQELQEGENVIRFTPTETGTFGYSCWMGMIRSSITVLADSNSVPTVTNDSTSGTVDNSGLPAGCCPAN